MALEKELADLHDKESALLFHSGYIANEATITTMSKLIPGSITTYQQSHVGYVIINNRFWPFFRDGDIFR